jgi:phospholipase C
MPMAMPQLNHIVVLMLENRAFDHMVGYMQSAAYRIDGIDAANPPANPMSPQDPKPVAATDDAPDVLSFDAGHSVTDTNLQLYFRVEGPPASGPTNKGFVYSYSQQQGVTAATAPLIMKCFPPDRLPVLTTLARQFALCTRWYSSMPGPTWPNRFFVHCATSKGFIDNSLLHNYDMRTIFENLSDVGGTWKIYSHDFPQAQVLNGISGPQFDDNWDSIGGFKDDAAANALPNYAFIEPKYTTFLGEANDQHPPHNVHAGEQLIADVYDALRNSAGWNDTLLIVLYDEHGGLFDHLLPPAATPPDGETSQFAFDRYGVRVPAVLISPYLKAGTIVDTVFDHSAIPAMVKKTFGLPKYLTKRDAAANTFEHVFNLAAPRTDAPTNLQALTGQPTAARDEWGDERATADEMQVRVARGDTSSVPVSDLQLSLVQVAQSHPLLAGDRVTELDNARPVATEHDAAVLLRQAAERIRRQRAMRHK